MNTATVRNATLAFLMAWGTGFAPTPPLAAQEASSDVAFVEAVTGRVVAFASGSPALLGPLDVISNRTRVDVLVNSELHLCHYRTGRLLTVQGPSRVMVSADAISIQAGKPVDISREKCNIPQASLYPGGLIARGVSSRK